MYYDDTSDAPWNEEEQPKEEVEIEVVVTLVKTVKAEVDDYIIKDEGIDDDGYPYKDLDFTNCDFTEAINNSIKDLKDLDSWEIDYIGTSVI